MGLLDRDYYLEHLAKLEAGGGKRSDTRRFSGFRKPVKCRCLLWGILLVLLVLLGVAFAIRHYPLSAVFDAVFVIRSFGKASFP